MKALRHEHTKKSENSLYVHTHMANIFMCQIMFLRGMGIPCLQTFATERATERDDDPSTKNAFPFSGVFRVM